MTQIETPDTSNAATPISHKTFVNPAEFVLLDAERRKAAARRRHRGALYRASTRRRIASAVAVGALVIVGASVADAAIQRTVMNSTAVSTSVFASSSSQSLATANATIAQLSADSRALTQLEISTKAALTALSVSGKGVPSVSGATANPSTASASAPTFTSSAPVVSAPATHAVTGASGGG